MADCSIDECDRIAVARGWCKLHWKRWWRHGDPIYVERIIGDLPARFMSKVDTSGECWLWTRSMNAFGYGTFGVGKTSKLAHRVAWEMFVGPIPDGMELDHICKVRNCVKVEHLEPVTHAENIRRSPLGGIFGENRRKTHCVRGHPFDEENTRISPKGSRVCRACMRMHVRNHRLKKIAEGRA